MKKLRKQGEVLVFTTLLKVARSSKLLWIVPVSAALLLAADPFWNAKRPPDWTEPENQKILTDSPWSRSIQANILRRQSEDERRAGGNMGQETGVGFDGLDLPKYFPTLQGMFFGIGEVRIRPATQTVGLLLRWETALPVRVAELKSHVIEPPTLTTDGYSLAIYGVPVAKVKVNDPKILGEPFMKTVLLKREGRDPVRPASVEVFIRDDMSLVVVTFPVAAEIVKKDGHVQIDVQIGRVVFAQVFDLTTMEFQGKLAL